MRSAYAKVQWTWKVSQKDHKWAASERDQTSSHVRWQNLKDRGRKITEA